MNRRIALLATLLTVACTQSADLPDLKVGVMIRDDQQGCLYSVDGKQFVGNPIGSREFSEYIATQENRKAIVVSDVHSPYKCIGAAIYELQRAGFPNPSLDGPSQVNP